MMYGKKTTSVKAMPKAGKMMEKPVAKAMVAKKMMAKKTAKKK
jgi:hypothetical protein